MKTWETVKQPMAQTANNNSSPEIKTEQALRPPKFSLFQIFFPISLLPVIGLVACLFFSVYYHYEDVIKTHCRNWEWLPSISSTIGNNIPEMFIWRYSIALYSAPKIWAEIVHFALLRWIRRQRHRGKLGWFQIWNSLALLTGILENCSLYLLTMVSSSEHRFTHELGFALLMIFAHLHFIFFLIAFYCARKPLQSSERNWFARRLFFALAHATLFLVALRLYFRHKKYCEPGMYSWFALCEWLVVAANIAFHMGFLWEYRSISAQIVVSHSSVSKNE
jgi:hypothetical protein